MCAGQKKPKKLQTITKYHPEHDKLINLKLPPKPLPSLHQTAQFPSLTGHFSMQQNKSQMK